MGTVHDWQINVFCIIWNNFMDVYDIIWIGKKTKGEWRRSEIAPRTAHASLRTRHQRLSRGGRASSRPVEPSSPSPRKLPCPEPIEQSVQTHINDQ